MGGMIRPNFRRAAAPVVEAAFLIGCFSFGLAGWATGPFFVFVIALCFARSFLRHWRKLYVISTVIYALFLVFCIDVLAGIWPLLYHSSPWGFLAYVLSIALSGMFLWRYPILGLRWQHGVLMAMVAVMGVFGFAISRYTSYQSCGGITRSPSVETLLDYRAAFNDCALIPRFLALDDREEVLFVANRIDWPRRDGLLRIDLNGHGYSYVDAGLPVGAMTFDPFSNNFLVATYFEPFPYETSNRPDAALIWIDREGNVKKRVPFGTEGDLYTSMYAGEKNIQVFVRAHFFTFDRKTGTLSEKHRGGLFDGFTSLMNFQMLEDRKIFVFGGPMLESFFVPSLVAADPETDKPIAGRKFLTGNYVLGYDRRKKELYTNAQWSGTLDVLDPDLNLLRSIKLASVIRTIAIDSDRRRGYVSDYLTGDVVAFDLDSTAIVGSVRLGPNARALRLTHGGDVIAGSVCGIFRVRPEAFQPSDGSGSPPQT